jgi:hypothetical protein
MAFVLKLVNSASQVVDFMGTGYLVSEGGFNISLSRREPKFAIYKPGPFFIPVAQQETYRVATLKFSAVGATRSAVLAQIGKVRQILTQAEARKRLGAGGRIELQYKWDGATNTTFFEVYGGDISLPDDALSIEKIHYKDENGNYVLPEIELTLYISTYGYSIDLFSGTPTQVELSNENGTDTLNYLTFRNAGEFSSNYRDNWVEIAADQLPGSEPYLTIIDIDTNDANFKLFDYLYIGLQPGDFPWGANDFPLDQWLILDEDENILSFGTAYSDSNCSNGYYEEGQYSGSVGVPSTATIAFNIMSSNPVFGTYYVFLNGRNYLPQNLHLAAGYNPDANHKWNLHYVGDFNSPADATTRYMALGPMQIPPDRDIAQFGVMDYGIEMGIFGGYEATPTTWSYDCIILLPMTGGLRIWQNRGVDTVAFLNGYLVDDGWKGVLYYDDAGAGNIRQPMIPYLEPLKLEPNMKQRLYFHSFATGGSVANHYARIMKVKVYVVPTFSTLAT